MLLPQSVLTAAAAQPDMSGFTARVLELTNAERQKAGLAPLSLSTQLTNAAQSYSQVLASSFTFTNVTAPHTIDVQFAIDTYDIAASAGSNGATAGRES